MYWVEQAKNSQKDTKMENKKAAKRKEKWPMGKGWKRKEEYAREMCQANLKIKLINS